MKVIQSLTTLKKTVDALKKKKQSIGFVPTMGFLHEGHLSLVRLSKKENAVTVVSIFVNPLQFGPREDFKRYPRSAARDRGILRKEKADILFKPRGKDFYPKDFETSVSPKNLGKRLCGLSRPTHFAGVATVVLKLVNLVRPDVMYLGQKDYQQCRVLERMVEDLNVPTTIRKVPTVREVDGVAMSSRNGLLTGLERARAPFLYAALRKFVRLVRMGERDAATLKKAMQLTLSEALGGIDYAEIVDAKTLRDMVRLREGDECLAAVAVTFGRTRLIDNILIRV